MRNKDNINAELKIVLADRKCKEWNAKPEDAHEIKIESKNWYNAQ